MTRIVAFVVAFVALSCASSPTAPTLHLLQADTSVPVVAPTQAPARVGLGAIEVAPYLDQAGIVVETEPGQVYVAKQHLWAEPLRSGVRAALRNSLSRAAGTDVPTNPAMAWETEVQVSVDRLHGTMTGDAILDARYRIIRPAGEPAAAEYRFSRSSALSAEGYGALVEAEARLLDELARAIADSLRELGAL